MLSSRCWTKGLITVLNRVECVCFTLSNRTAGYRNLLIISVLHPTATASDLHANLPKAPQLLDRPNQPIHPSPFPPLKDSRQASTILYPSTEQTSSHEGNEYLALGETRAAKLGINTHGAGRQDAEESRDPIDRPRDGADEDKLAAQLGRLRPPPRIVERQPGQDYGEEDCLSVVESSYTG